MFPKRSSPNLMNWAVLLLAASGITRCLYVLESGCRDITRDDHCCRIPMGSSLNPDGTLSYDGQQMLAHLGMAFGWSQWDIMIKPSPIEYNERNSCNISWAVFLWKTTSPSPKCPRSGEPTPIAIPRIAGEAVDTVILATGATFSIRSYTSYDYNWLHIHT